MKIHVLYYLHTFTVVSDRKKIKTNKERGTHCGDERILKYCC